MKSGWVAAVGVLLLSACDAQPTEPRVQAENAMVRLAPLPTLPSAGYLTLRSNSAPTRLVAVTSPKVGRIELHATENRGGTMSMRPLRAEELVFERGELRFAPGGKHLMLYEVAPDVRAGGRLPLLLRFEPAMTVTVEAEVRAAGDAEHGGMGH